MMLSFSRSALLMQRAPFLHFGFQVLKFTDLHTASVCSMDVKLPKMREPACSSNPSIGFARTKHLKSG